VPGGLVARDHRHAEAEAHQVPLGEPDGSERRAAAPLEVQLGLCRPLVVRDHEHVDRVDREPRVDGLRLHVLEVAQEPLALLHVVRGPDLPGLDEELRADRRRPGAHVQLVRNAVERPEPAVGQRIEDVEVLHVDLADRRALAAGLRETVPGLSHPAGCSSAVGSGVGSESGVTTAGSESGSTRVESCARAVRTRTPDMREARRPGRPPRSVQRCRVNGEV